jgi:hypothetical protein
VSVLVSTKTELTPRSPKQAFNKTQLQQLRVKSAFLTDTYGRPIDGNHDGQLGGDFVATLKGKSVTIAATSAAGAASASQLALEADDRVLAGNTQLLTRPVRSFHAQRKPHGVTQESQAVKVVLPASKEYVGKSAWLRRVFTMTHRLPHDAPGAAPHRMVRL